MIHLGLDRRALLVLPLTLLCPSAAPADEIAMRFPEPIPVSAQDIAWFRSLRSLWVEGESGAPAVFPQGVGPETAMDWPENEHKAYAKRLEPILCVFFLHASFEPGYYRFAEPLDGRSEIEVSVDDVKLLRITSWRTFAIDNKRPYGDFTNFVIDMARALGVPITESPEGYAEITPEEDRRMEALHRRVQFVLQAYLEHARLEPGRRLVPRDGWDTYIRPLCKPVSQGAIDAYEAAMALIAARAKRESAYDLVVPRFQAQAILFPDG